MLEYSKREGVEKVHYVNFTNIMCTGARIFTKRSEIQKIQKQEMNKKYF